MSRIIDRALDIINDRLKTQTSELSPTMEVRQGMPGMAHGGHVLEDDYPTHYLPEVGRQVMADGGMPAGRPDISRFIQQIQTQQAPAQQAPVVSDYAYTGAARAPGYEPNRPSWVAPGEYVQSFQGGYPTPYVYGQQQAPAASSGKFDFASILGRLFGGMSRGRGYAEGGMPDDDPVARALQTAQDVSGTEAPDMTPRPTTPSVPSAEGRVIARPQSPKLAETFAKENVPGVVVSPRPGKGSGPRVLPEAGVPYEQPEYEGYGARGETPTSDIEFSPSTPAIAGSALPPPVQHPLQNEPRLQKVTENTQRILKSPGLRKLVEDHVGLKGPLQVTPTHGTWLGEAEPSFIINHPDMQPEHAEKLAHMLGFGFQQDAVVHNMHNPDIEQGAPAVLMGHGKKLKPEDIDKISGAAKNHGLDFTVTQDGKAAKFVYFGDADKLDDFYKSVVDISKSAGLKDLYHARTQGALINAKDYLNGIFGATGGEARDQAGAERSPDLFGRIVDHVLAPYAKAVAGEGYRLSPERLAETFGLTQDEQNKVRDSLYPKSKGDRTTVPLMSGTEDLDVRPTGARGNATVNDVLYALQNRAAEKGQIDPGDFSDKAKKSIASDIADEVKYHVDNSDKSAVGWYDAALKKAKDMYHSIFPELKVDKDKEMLFDAILGITSQGNDVHSNSVFAARMYDKIRNQGKSIPEAVKDLSGGFGAQTKAIEGNLMKLHHLLDQNGFDRMRDLFNQRKTVSEWNKILRSDPSLKVPGQELLKMQGAGDQNVTGWMVFGPKIGSFINNLHGDYSTLTADLWFSRTWNRLLGHNFIHSPLAEQKQYQDFKDAVKAEFLHHNGLPHEQYAGKTSEGQYQKDASGNIKPWTFGNDMKDMSYDDFNNMINDPEKMQELASNLYEQYKGGGFKDKSDARRRAKNWMENRDLPVAAPRGDKEREFQQNTVEEAQKMLKKKGLNISIADIQAALWFHEKELFGKLGVAPERAQPADYADAAKRAMELIKNGELYRVKSKEKKPERAYGGAIAGPKLTEENAEDFARRLILWSYAAAPFVHRGVSRADGGQVDNPDNQALDVARSAVGSDPVEAAVSTARSLTPMGFYSAAAEAASKIPQRAPIDQILNKVKGSPNVKAEELDWSGVRDAFTGKGSVDPQEVARHFQENLPQLQETVKYDPVDISNKLAAKRQSYIFNGQRDEAEALKDEITQSYNPSWRRDNAARYKEEYTLPDGENYREVLLHLPAKVDSSGSKEASNFANSMQQKYGERWIGMLTPEEEREYENLINSQSKKEDASTYQSSHWNVPNVVAHLRMSDRDWGKTLHIEEMQSDWGQEGRDDGFVEPGEKAGLDESESAEFKRLNSTPDSVRTPEENQRLDYFYEQLKRKQKGIPQGPHVTSNEGWTDLALKRALLEAAKGGYKKLIWTPGNEQAERYDLSNQVKHIMWSPDNKILSALTHDGSEAIGEKVEKEDLHKYIGKEAAKRLLDQEPEIAGNMATHHLRGQDISVGGEGMKNFYDRFVPNRLQKLVSKLDPEAKIQMNGHTIVVADKEDEDIDVHKKLHSLEITPKLRAAILKGLPAYEQGGAIVNKALDVVSGLRR